MPHRSYLELALRGDRPGIRHLVDLLRASGYTPDRIALELIEPTLVEVGDRWMRNELSVADEHLVSAISERILAETLMTLPHPPDDAPLVLLACVSSEAHRIGQLILECLFLQAGFRVHALGGQVPTLDLLGLTRRLRPDVLGLSVTMSYHVPEAAEAVAQLRTITSAPILVGGAIFESFPELAAQIPADWIGGDARNAVRFAREHLASHPMTR